MDKAFPGVRYVLNTRDVERVLGSGFWRDADADEARSLIERVVEIQEHLRATRPDRVHDVRYEELTGPDPDGARRRRTAPGRVRHRRAGVAGGARVRPRGAGDGTRAVPLRAAGRDTEPPTRVTPMSRRLVLHVGAMKSGTSYVQSRLFANKRMLLDRGILVPGMNWLSQVMAARDVLGSGEAQWAKMAGKVQAHEGTSVISMEYLGPVRPVVVRRVLASFPDHEVTVVVTARDLNRSIAAMWQETVQNGRTWTFADYLAGIEAWRPGHRDESAEPPESGRTFWRQQNIVRFARTWGEQVGAPRRRW